MAVDCTGFSQLAIKGTSPTEVGPIQPTIDKMCVYVDTKKDAGASVSPRLSAG
ncbi:hypothetical protein [Escherichia phage ArgO145]|uniref:Uncharacterized protein n=1 Tax=Escherichia phage ArgO145 TaxID=1983463 RepID=A0A2R2Z317_9CAUD|nr:hypothetical protein H3H23_gp32 [Escherichia phage ArgO145]ARW58347.1 hypothetical protein [Escherichia phage ArgO145]